MSLRFLSWYVLGEHIQTETHDSIEDARSALRLYQAYQEFEEQGIFDQKLEEIYRDGRQLVSTLPYQPTTINQGYHRILNHRQTLARTTERIQILLFQLGVSSHLLILVPDFPDIFPWRTFTRD